MERNFRLFRSWALLVCAAVYSIVGVVPRLWATPSTTYWTPATMDFQPFKVGHITYDNYTSLGQGGPAKGGQQFANDLGLTVGVLPFDNLQMEVGFDWMEPTDYPLFFNAKIGFTEGRLFTDAPALEVGIFNVGIKAGVTDQNVLYVLTGHSLPFGLGRVHLSAYSGNSAVLVGSDGSVQNQGFMAAYDYGFLPVKTSDGEFNRLMLAADYASGKNAIGGGGVGLYVYYTPNIDILSGPVWYNDSGINGNWKWTTQLDINF